MPKHLSESETSQELDPVLLACYDDNDIRNIMFETLENEDYALGKLGNLEVLMMAKNGYINITKLCKESRKKFNHWTDNASSQNLIREIGKSLGYAEKDTNIASKLIIAIRTGNNYYRGSYVHPELAIHVATWCNAKYATIVSKVMVEYHSKESVAERNELKRKNKMLAKDNRSLQEKVDELLAINKQQLRMLQEQAETLDELHDQNEDICDKLNVACKTRVVDGKPAKANILTVVKNNAKPKKPKKNDPPYYEYKVFRTARRNLNSLYKTHRAKFPAFEEVFRIEYTPNSVQLWHRFVEKYGESLDCNGCMFNLNEETTLKQALRRLDRVHKSRYDMD